jgi:hypothetical protein
MWNENDPNANVMTPDGQWAGNTPVKDWGLLAEKNKRQRLMAELLRKQYQQEQQGKMISTGGGVAGFGALPDIYVAPNIMQHAQGPLSELVAGMQERKSDAEDKAASEAQMAEYQNAMSSLPSVMEMKKVTTTTPGEPVLQDQQQQTPSGDVMPGTMLPQARAQFQPGPDVTTESEVPSLKAFPQYMAEQQKWASSLNNTNPQLAGIAKAAQAQALTAPEKYYEQQQKAKDASDALEEKLKVDREKLADRRDQALRDAKNDAEKIAADKEWKQGMLAVNQKHDDTLRLIASGNNATARAIAESRITAAGDKAKAKSSPADTREAARKALLIAGVTDKTDEMENLISKSTSGGLQKSVAGLKEWVTGEGTSGQEAIGKLATKANAITFDLLNGKLGAGISNADVAFLQSTLGAVADSTKSANVRLAAWKSAKARLQAIANGTYDLEKGEMATVPTVPQADMGMPPPGAVREK